jgi:class 3 adenylate cyclase
MTNRATVVFTDLHGSTAAFGVLGNARATAVITQLVEQITVIGVAHGGAIVKKLGDGVMLVFSDPAKAIEFAIQVQRSHLRMGHIDTRTLSLPIKIGIDAGEIEQKDGDYYGDAVNVAARLCDMAGPHQIWASKSAVAFQSHMQVSSVRALGVIPIRGRLEQCAVHQIEWKEDEQSDFLTMQAQIAVDALAGKDALGKQVRLRYLDQTSLFRSFELPAHIGRVKSAEFVVTDPRVSRSHARLVWRNGGVIIEDLSTYGTWVRFANALASEMLLRRDECALHGKGELALGAPFGDISAPVVSFEVF